MAKYNRYINYVKKILNESPEEWSFKSHPDYMYMLEHVSKEQGNMYLEGLSGFLTSYNFPIRDKLLEITNSNDKFGNPKKEKFDGFMECSPTNLRYIRHSLNILDFIKQNKLTKDINIIEIGGGYGGLCLFIQKLGEFMGIKINSYTIFDLPEAMQLQEKYLNACSVNVKFNSLDNLKKIESNSFLVSTYAFSEIDMKLQQLYTEKVLNPFVSHGYIAWNMIDVYDFIDNKDIMTEPEVPKTGRKNCIVKFRPKQTS